jgi:hypothetical protein
MEIDQGEILFSEFLTPYILDDYLIISDYKSYDKLIYIFNKNNFKYLASTATWGQGPSEIINMGHIAVDEAHRSFLVTDNGKYKIFNFELDSVLNNPDYLPQEKFTMDEKQFPRSFYLANDTLAACLFIKPVSNSDYRPVVGKWNTKTGNIELMAYEGHPEVIRKRADFAVSFEIDLYVECYWHHDLMTIGSLNKGFKRNIYGLKWNTKHSNEDLYYGRVVITEDRILASYLGGDNFYKKADGNIGDNSPTKLLVFDLDGNYIQTLDVGINIQTFCYDRDNHRVIISTDDERLIVYLDLEGILE